MMAAHTCAVALAAQAAPAVGRFAVPGDESVNSWIVDAPDGLIVVDLQRDRVSVDKLIAAVRAKGRPLRAVLLTHAHPDHIGALDQFATAFPGVPVHAGTGTAREIRGDRVGFQKLARQGLGANAPRGYPVPSQIFTDGATLRVAGPVARIADEAARTLTTYRRLVAAAKPVAGVLTPAQVKAVAAQVRAELGERPPVAPIPNLIDDNIKAVARELGQLRG